MDLHVGTIMLDFLSMANVVLICNPLRMAFSGHRLINRMINLSVYLPHPSGFFYIFCVLSSVLSEVMTIFMIISSLLHRGFRQFSCWVKFLNRGYSSWILFFSRAQVLVRFLAVFVQVWMVDIYAFA